MLGGVVFVLLCGEGAAFAVSSSGGKSLLLLCLLQGTGRLKMVDVQMGSLVVLPWGNRGWFTYEKWNRLKG